MLSAIEGGGGRTTARVDRSVLDAAIRSEHWRALSSVAREGPPHLAGGRRDDGSLSKDGRWSESEVATFEMQRVTQ